MKCFFMMEEEDLPFVALIELDCLRQGWPKPLFVFMSRYQHDLKRMRRECKERFGCTQSGNCTHCGKFRFGGPLQGFPWVNACRGRFP